MRDRGWMSNSVDKLHRCRLSPLIPRLCSLGRFLCLVKICLFCQTLTPAFSFISAVSISSLFSVLEDIATQQQPELANTSGHCFNEAKYCRMRSGSSHWRFWPCASCWNVPFCWSVLVFILWVFCLLKADLSPIGPIVFCQSICNTSSK